jgi:hypothetical protein
MLDCWSEPSLAETLSDPVVQAVMAADAVDPTALDALLRVVAHRVEPPRALVSVGRCTSDANRGSVLRRGSTRRDEQCSERSLDRSG